MDKDKETKRLTMFDMLMAAGLAIVLAVIFLNVREIL